GAAGRSWARPESGSSGSPNDGPAGRTTRECRRLEVSRPSVVWPLDLRGPDLGGRGRDRGGPGGPRKIARDGDRVVPGTARVPRLRRAQGGRRPARRPQRVRDQRAPHLDLEPARREVLRRIGPRDPEEGPRHLATRA